MLGSPMLRTIGVVIVAFAMLGLIGPSASSPASAPRGGGPNLPGFALPYAAFLPRPVDCANPAAAPFAGPGLPNVTAAGTGVAATANASSLANNSGVNSTMTVPTAAVSANQFILFAVEEPVTPTTVVAVGFAETSVPVLGRIAVPIAYLPNGTEVYPQSTGSFLTAGSAYTFAALHSHGNWWRLTWNGNAITGAASWEDGTYDLGTPTAVGVACGAGVSLSPSFLAALYANGTTLPTLPPTLVRRAVGVASGTSLTASYRPTGANALPQLAPALGTVGIEGVDQNASLAVGEIRIGSTPSVAYPGANASLWGRYVVRGVGNLSVAPGNAILAPRASQGFTVTVLDTSGATLPTATVRWQLAPASLGSLNASTGTTVTLTAGTSLGIGSLWANASFNCSELGIRIPFTVSPPGVPAITSFTAVPPELEVGQATVLTVVNATWPRPVSFAYAGLPAPCVSANSSRLACRPGEAGTFPVRVYVNDSTGAGSNVTTTLTVVASLGIGSFSTAPSTVALNSSVNLRVVVTGGAAPFSYNYSGLPTGCRSANNSNLTCTPTGLGKFELTARVTDRLGGAAEAQANLTVEKAPGTPSGNNSTSTGSGGGRLLGLPPTEAYALIGILIAGLASAIALGVARRRRMPRPPEPSPQAPPPPG